MICDRRQIKSEKVAVRRYKLVSINVSILPINAIAMIFGYLSVLQISVFLGNVCGDSIS
ncbi:MAG: hypothetical protein QNJ60_18405 [Xenococcaceae cyanobacterium MO_188.B19]|nr:hypothetical protein [Xenococcaceae cyanobacterium MO_188.B19]